MTKVQPARLTGNITTTQLLLGIGLILIAFWVRIHSLEGDSFWVDEIESIKAIRGGWQAIQGDRVHPGLYYLITAGARAIYGETEFGLRLPALFTGTVTISLIIAAGRLLRRTSIGLWAALFLALSPFHLRYSQEVRMYGQLMTLSLIASLYLYKGLKQPKWSTWAAYIAATALNLYTHYGSLIVLASQAILIAAWATIPLYEGKKQDLKYPVVSELVIFLLYLPWIPRLIDTLQYNVGAGTVTDTGTRQPLVNWVKVTYIDFGMFDSRLAAVLQVLLLLGLGIWILRRQWGDLAWIVTGLFLPIPLVYMFQVARGAYSRYLIYMLPFYLLTIAFAVDTLLQAIRSRMGQNIYHLSCIIIAILISWFGVPRIQAEQDRINEDWLGIIAYLDQNAEEDAILLALPMNFQNGWNNVNHVLPTYLARAAQSYYFLDGNHVAIKDVAPLVAIDREVWAIASSWAPIHFKNKSIEVEPFQSSFYVVHEKRGTNSALSSAIRLYEEILPYASKPDPHCLLKQDLSTLYLAASEYWVSQKLLDEAIDECSDPLGTEGIRSTLVSQINEAYETYDWSRFVDDLEKHATNRTIFWGLNLDSLTPSGGAVATLPYYLMNSKEGYQYYEKNHLDSVDIDQLGESESDLWFVIRFPRAAVSLVGSWDTTAEVIKLMDDVFLVRFTEQEGSVLNKLNSAYWKWFYPLTRDTELSCRIISEFLPISGKFVDSKNVLLMLSLNEECNIEGLEDILHQAIRDKFETLIQNGELDKAREYAPFLIRFDPKDAVALELATAQNLMEDFAFGRVQIDQNSAPEPVDSRQFTMPHNGDWGDVIFLHPPAEVNFSLTLPDAPVSFRSRVALDPQSWSWSGDGVTFIVTIPEDGGLPAELYRTHVANDESGHDWHTVLVSLADYAGKEVVLTLATASGPAGDGTGDWAGWESPRLTWELMD